LTQPIANWKGPRLLGAVPAGLTAALLIAGCGGGSDEEPAQISKVAFVERGSAICLSAKRQIRSDFEAYRKGRQGEEIERAEKANELTPEEAAAKVGKEIIVPVMRQELEEFRALGIPAGDDEQVDALLAAFEEGVEKAERHPERAAMDGTEAFGGSGKVADGYGLENC
jgi:hypothetical protein